MWRTLAAVLILLLLARELPSRSNHNWENVKKLKPGTIVRVLLWSGEEPSGAVDAVSNVGLRVATVGRNGPGVGWLRDIDRTRIRRIVRIRKSNLPDPKRWMVRSAVAGGAIGLTAGAVSDIKHGDNYHWFEGALGGAGLGFFASCAALLAVGTVDLAQGVRGEKVVYEDQGNNREAISGKRALGGQ
jgi:hypothetical protein